MNNPDIYILGSPESGAKTVGSWLQSHPDVIQSGNGEQSSANISVEISPGHLYTQDDIPGIMDHNPAAKFVICLRDPAEIAWAVHAQNLEAGIEHVRAFDTAWELSLARREGRGCKMCSDTRLLDYTAICTLGCQVARLLTMVPDTNTHFIYFEDIESAPIETWQDLREFANISDSHVPDFSIKDVQIKKSLIPLHEITDRARRLKRIVFPTLRTGIRLGSRINGVSKIPGTMTPPTQETRHIVYDRLSEDVATLSVVTDRELLHWIS